MNMKDELLEYLSLKYDIDDNEVYNALYEILNEK